MRGRHSEFKNENAWALVDLQDPKRRYIVKPDPSRLVYRITEAGMEAAEAKELGRSAAAATAAAPSESDMFGVSGRRRVGAAYARELDVLRSGSVDEMRAYLEQHLHSNRCYIDGDKMWLELPEQAENELTSVIDVWFRRPESFQVLAPVVGSRAGTHAVPNGWPATLCRILLESWGSGIAAGGSDVTCRWCRVRLLAAELLTDEPIDLQPA